MSKTYTDLVELLYKLDKRIEREYPNEHITYRMDVIGGFALLYHGFRVSVPLTRDIDLINEMSARLWRISQEVDNTNWLNDHANEILFSMDKDIKNALKFTKDEKYRFPYNHIDLYIAPIDTLIATKLYSLVNQAGQGITLDSLTRCNDRLDLIEIFRLYNICNEIDFKLHYPDLSDYIDKEKDVFNMFKLWGK